MTFKSWKDVKLLDVRPGKGITKIRTKDNWEIQIDNKTAEVLAAGTYNETNLFDFSQWIMNWITKYPNITVLIERQNSGPTILDILIRLCVANDEDPFKRLFNWVVNDYTTKDNFKNDVIDVIFSKRSQSVYDKYSSQFGFRTSGGGRTARSNLYGDVFNTAVKYSGRNIRDSVLIDQLTTLTVKSGRIDHRSGSHDDMVVSWLLAYWFLQSASNKSFYGFKEDEVLKDVEDKTPANIKAQYKKRSQDKLIKQISKNMELLKLETNTYKIKILTSKIIHDHKHIDKSTSGLHNLTAIINKIRSNNFTSNRKGY